MTRSSDGRRPLRVLVATDKFKGCLNAIDVAGAVADGLVRARDDIEVTVMPVADGGDGTVQAALSAGYQPMHVPAVGPTGEPVVATYALDAGRGVAVVELAGVVGLDLLPAGTPDPLGASTYGLGLVITDALRSRGVDRLVIGVGGSASTDGGAGMAQAMGVGLYDEHGAELPLGGGALRQAASIDTSALPELLGRTVFHVATDVDSPLLGPAGAAAVFGPQKGATEDEVADLEAGLTAWAEVVAAEVHRDVAGMPGSGAAGGTAFGAVALFGAEIEPGIDLVLQLLGFESALDDGADLVVTGEGSLDEQSLAGKAPVGVARAARARGIPVVAVAGRCTLSTSQLASVGISAAYPLSDLEPDPARSIAHAAELLTRTGERIAADRLG